MGPRRRGVVLIMVIAILATLAVAGTAFVVYMGQEDRAAANALHLAQAELAARSGLEHAIGVIDESLRRLALAAGDPDRWLAVTPDGVLADDGTFPPYEVVATASPPVRIGVGWHRYFEQPRVRDSDGAVLDTQFEQLSDPAKWVSHYFADTSWPADGTNDERYGAPTPLDHEMRGRVFDFPPGTIWAKRGEYAVCIADLDGKLHANIAAWKGGVGFDGDPDGDGTFTLADLEGMVAAVAKAADPDDPADPEDPYVTDTQAGDLAKQSSFQPFSSTSEIARRAGVTAVQPKYALERLFTAYPVPGSDDPTVHEHDGSPAYDGTSYTTATLVSTPLPADGEMVGMAALFRQSGRLFGIASNVGPVWTLVGDCTDASHGTQFVVVPRPAVNVNTAPEALLAELLKPPMRLEDDLAVEEDDESDVKAKALARLICERRPFADRHELEDLVFRVVGNQEDDLALIPWPGNGAIEKLKDSAGGNVPNLTERQFNDVLNCIAGRLAPEESAFDEPLNPGVYSFDGWEPYDDLVGPSQTGGARSDRTGALATLPGEAADNVTWSTELKFDSRFFHIYVVGRGWNENTAEPVGVKRLHAIYDAKPGPGTPGKVIWLRWNLTSRGSLTDM